MAWTPLMQDNSLCLLQVQEIPLRHVVLWVPETKVKTYMPSCRYCFNTRIMHTATAHTCIHAGAHSPTHPHPHTNDLITRFSWKPLNTLLSFCSNLSSRPKWTPRSQGSFSNLQADKTVKNDSCWWIWHTFAPLKPFSPSWPMRPRCPYIVTTTYHWLDKTWSDVTFVPFIPFSPFNPG